jgi:hypothetical protein
MPIGDQKTGVIAEFYSRIFAEAEFPGAQLVYGHPSEHVWDITIRRDHHPDHKIQVKSVSAHSKTSRISPVHPGWDELYLMRLDENFHPIGFWTLLARAVDWSSQKLGASTMPGAGRKGSSVYNNAISRIDELNHRLLIAQC